MEKTILEPRVEEGAVLFNVIANNIERKCILSKNALAYLSRLQEKPTDTLDIYSSYEAQIHKVAKRLVLAGESASPLILGTAYFIGLSTPS